MDDYSNCIPYKTSTIDNLLNISMRVMFYFEILAKATQNCTEIDETIQPSNKTAETNNMIEKPKRPTFLPRRTLIQLITNNNHFVHA